MNVSLRPDRSLLDSNFESYKLSLTAINVERLPVVNGIYHLGLPDATSKQHIKAFTNQNCLTCDPYSPGTVYYINCNGSCMEILKPPLQHANTQLLDTLVTSKKDESEILLDVIFASVGERTQAVPVKGKSSIHATYLEWLTYSQLANRTWSLQRHRRFTGTTFPDYVTFERDAQALHICAERTFDLIYDSLNPLVEEKACGDHDALEASSESQNVTPSLHDQNEAEINTQLIKWTQPLSEERMEISLEIDLQRLPMDTDSFDDVGVVIKPMVINDTEYQALQIQMSAADSGDQVKVLFNEALYGETEPQLEFSVNNERKSLMIRLTKLKAEFWPRILHDVKANRNYVGPPQQSLCASEVEHLQEGSVATSNGDGGRSFVAVQPPFNIEQLEEVDFPDKDVDDDLLLQRIESVSSRVTHQVNLCGHQWLFNGVSHRSGQADLHANTAICLRHDVDGIMWLPVCEEDNFQWRHIGTLQAFGYVLASKRDRRFVSCPPLTVDSSNAVNTGSRIPFVAVADNNKRIYIYRQPVSSQEHGFGKSDTELRKLRSEGTDKSRVVHVAWQHVVNLPEDGSIIGFVTLAQPYPACLACTSENIYLMSLV